MSGWARALALGVAGFAALGDRILVAQPAPEHAAMVPPQEAVVMPARPAPAPAPVPAPTPAPTPGVVSALTPTTAPLAIVPPPPPGPPETTGSPAWMIERAIVERARREVETGVAYDARYWRLAIYPGGDLPPNVGACTDLVIRALRAIAIDLQPLVHEDILAAPGAYAGTRMADANIDHRRVPTLYTWFERNAQVLPTDARRVATFRPGDVVFYARPPCTVRTSCIPAHVAIVSDRVGPRGFPLILENGGPQAREGDGLDQPTMVGHYRIPWR